MVAFVMLVFVASARKSLYQCEQAPRPCHTWGGKSSMTVVSSAQLRSPALESPVLKLFAQAWTTSKTSELSDAGVDPHARITRANSDTTIRPGLMLCIVLRFLRAASLS